MFAGKFEELLIVLLIILLLFGAKKIPELARSIGQSINEVKKGVAGESSDDTVEKKA
ncbi:MAG TPA: twin-arginine translocase TatA/TatE family subunit [Candidatus Saccharimonadales bacterium]|nr:twin-arginine translocase TatA/TatE family subunit [Candidatus Saccharimonadales bacterium]